ncbi:MAG TPA: hypothetical protein VEB22_07740 [Phycisphaerales bacterium]|nr:hypothetical protein [Phycisphaerales bacterium]
MQINGNNQAALLTRMYGGGGTAPVRGPAQASVVAKVGPSQPAAPVDKAEVKGRAPGMNALIAAVVPGKVDFSGEAAKPSSGHLGAGGTYQMYRRPTDRMEAATVVSLGRGLDIQG